jgi:hypothetical protein
MRKRASVVLTLIITASFLNFVPAFAADSRPVDVVSVTWPGAAAIPSTVGEIFGLIDSDVSARWKNFTTLVGDTKDRTINFVSGEILPTPIELKVQMACGGTASSTFMYGVRNEAYKRLGISDFSNRYLIIVAPESGCVWSGRSPLGDSNSTNGIVVLHDSGSAFVITHELGHTFGLGHTNFLRCASGERDGQWGADCKAVEYGGVVDVMGNLDTRSPLNTYHQWRMGLLDDSQIKQVWQSETVRLSPSDFANGIRAIYMRDGQSAYWVEYRRANPELNYKAGLVVFRLDPPPVSAIVSPNSADLLAGEFGAELGTDVWMLNLDDYTYVLSKASGSMSALSATTYSGNIAINAQVDGDFATVVITRKPDVTPPPTPVLTNPNTWNFPSAEIIESGYGDNDTEISSYQSKIDGVINEVKASDVENWFPTYLQPFTTPKTLQVRDLPEGSYALSIRAKDLAGNVSNWSESVQVTVDRARPIVTSEFKTTAIAGSQINLAWAGAKDAGSGICLTNIVNEEGVIIQSSSETKIPMVAIAKSETLIGKAQVFDCLGNGVVGDLTVATAILSADKATRSGKWTLGITTSGLTSLKCTGKCSASFSAKGHADVLVGAGAAIVSVGGKPIANIADSKLATMRVGASIDVGKTKRIIRVSGTNFTVFGLNLVTSHFTNVNNLDRLPTISDLSLLDAEQNTLGQYGFNRKDLSQEWTVLPMDGGTTIDAATLDLCNASYPSELERISRRQVVVTKKDSPYKFLSTEVVTYSSTTAAQQAHKELMKAFSDCTKNNGYMDANGVMVPYVFKELPNLPNGLVDAGSRLVIRAVIDSGSQARELLGIYQFNGDIFTGLYVMTTPEQAMNDQQIQRWLQVAVTLAERLNGKAA